MTELLSVLQHLCALLLHCRLQHSRHYQRDLTHTQALKFSRGVFSTIGFARQQLCHNILKRSHKNCIQTFPHRSCRCVVIDVGVSEDLYTTMGSSGPVLLPGHPMRSDTSGHRIQVIMSQREPGFYTRPVNKTSFAAGP